MILTGIFTEYISERVTGPRGGQKWETTTIEIVDTLHQRPDQRPTQVPSIHKHTTMNVTELIEACNKANIRYEQMPNMIGICLGKGVWHWYRHWDGNNLLFDHSYSQNNGSTKRGFRQNIRTAIAIEKRLKLPENSL